MREVIGNRNFSRLWISQIILTLGGALVQMGFIELFRVRGYDVRAEMAKFSFAVALPGLVLGPVAMNYIDRWQRRRVLLTGDALRVALVLVIAIWILPMLTGGSLWRVYWLMGVIGVIAAFYLPARAAVIPNLVSTELLMKANSIFASSLAIATVGGAAIGGFVAERLGTTWAILMSAGAFAMSFAIIWTIRMPPHETTGKNRNRRGEFVAGCAYLWQHPTALPLVLMSGFFAFLLGILMVVFVGYTLETLKLGTAGLGYLVTAGGLGAGLGIALLGRGKPWTHSNWVPFFQLLLAAVALTGLGLTRSIAVAALVVVALGAVTATVMIYVDARLQAQVQDLRRGAVFAARGMFTSTTMILAFWLQFGTPLIKRTPPETVLLWLGGGTFLAALLLFAALRVNLTSARPVSGTGCGD